MPNPVQKVIVVGGGTAGFLAALSLKIKIPHLQVVVIRSSKIGTIMVGEGTTDSVPVFLHGYLGIDPAIFHAQVQPTWKAGIRFIWGPREQFNYTFSRQMDSQYDMLPRPNGFYCQDVFDYNDISGALMQNDRIFERQPNGAPIFSANVAYHLENHRIVGFLEKYARQQGIEIYDDTISDVEVDERGVKSLSLESGRVESADMYVDCSGFRSLLLGGALQEPFESFDSTLFCDTAIAGAWKRDADEEIKPYTTSETMDSGWAWKIEHENELHRGYVYCSDMISDADADAEFRAKNPKITETRKVSFKTGRYVNSWVRNVAAIGNSSGFVEPLQSSSLAVICEMCVNLVRVVMEGNGRITDSNIRFYNKSSEFLWTSIRRFLAVNYAFNTRIDTPFWQRCINETDLAGAEEFVEYYKKNGPSIAWSTNIIHPLDPFGYEGFLTMMVGQKVPYQNDYQPEHKEWQFWNSARAQHFVRAREGYTVRQTLDKIRDPRWRWDPEFYMRAARWG
jgi:tryptophan halogenase